MESNLIGLTSILLLGIGAQWIAWRVKFPSILFLLLFGFIAGPVTGFLNPSELLGNFLYPFVSVSIAVILFEGGLTLRLKELRTIGRTVLSLVTIGVLVTWAISTAAAYYLLNLSFQVSLLLGSILVVTGPTVIGPLLRHIKPVGKSANVLKWEGIVIDPIGVLLAVVVFDAILIGKLQEAGTVVMLGIAKTLIFGSLIGIGFAWLLLMLIRKYWIPDYLQETVTLATVVAAFLISDLIQKESGLVAATLMGIMLDNQKLVAVKHIAEFKENLRILIISSLFIILAAQIDIESIKQLSFNSITFLFVLIFLARPLSVFISTYRSGLKLNEKIFLSWMAPRGIVAAAISSIFALELSKAGMVQTDLLVPIVFIVIVGTVLIYGITAMPLARRLKLSQTEPQGVLFLGAHPWAVEMASHLKSKGFHVAMIDTNRNSINKAKMQGLPAYNGNVMSSNVIDNVDLSGIGRMVALTSNDEANSLGVLHLEDLFSREELYQLPTVNEQKPENKDKRPQHLHGRFLFGKNYNFYHINNLYQEGYVIKTTRLTDEFDYQAFKAYYDNSLIPMFIIKENKKFIPVTIDFKMDPNPGDYIIAMVYDKTDK